MTSPFTIECCVNFGDWSRGSRKRLIQSNRPSQFPRISRLMALAIRFADLMRSGEVASYAELAEMGHVTTARMTQIMSLLSLAPDIQEEILFLPSTSKGRDRITLRHILPITAFLDWREQRVRWKNLNLRLHPPMANEIESTPSPP